MLTLDEARKIQSKREKNSIAKFLLFSIIILTAMFLLIGFTDYLTQYKALYAVFIVLFLVTVKYSKIYVLLQHKEFVGTVEYSNINMEPVKRYASHQPGVNYTSDDVPVLDLMVVNNKGQKLRKTTEYNWMWGEYKAGCKVTVLRFIDQPLLNKAE